MKLPLILFLLLPVLGFSQATAVKKKSPNAAPKIISKPDTNLFLGIGVFKIGSDTSTLISYASSHTAPMRTINSFEELYSRIEADADGTTKEVFRLQPGGETESIGLLESYCPNVSEYYLSQYDVAGIVIKNIRLKYFFGKLVEFKCDASQEITDALTVKYSKPTLKVTKETFKCMHNLTGIATPLEAKTYSETWRNGTITATSLLWEHYDDHCQKSINQVFYYNVQNPALKECENKGLNKAIDKTPNIQKDKLKEF